jgi:CelD/BcsL family acetyltransferase involved in cellulose biosynthesis
MTARLTFLDARDARVEAIWRTLEAAARPTYFLTWGWIETWLAALPPVAMPRLAVIREGGAVVAACFLGDRRMFRRRVIPLRATSLNTTGIPQLDELCIEHNNVLCVPGTSWSLAALIELLPPAWDELALPAIDASTFEPLAVGDAYQVHVDRDVSAPFIDLARVRAAGDYLSLLSSNTRAQIRRARRTVGPCELEIARSPAHAFEIYRELVTFHTARWRERGQPGVFADPWFDRFHRRLIEQRLPHGEIELVRVRAGGKTIGCLYNLVANGHVLFYQSGFAQFEDPHIKPGYLCHALAIEHAAAAGHAVYDLLGGDARYKASLSTDATRLLWLRVQRRRKRFVIEQQLEQWKRAYVAWRATRNA